MDRQQQMAAVERHRGMRGTASSCSGASRPKGPRRWTHRAGAPRLAPAGQLQPEALVEAVALSKPPVL